MPTAWKYEEIQPYIAIYTSKWLHIDIVTNLERNENSPGGRPTAWKYEEIQPCTAIYTCKWLHIDIVTNLERNENGRILAWRQADGMEI